MFKEFMAQYGMDIINTVVVAILGYVGIVIKNIYKKYVNTEMKASIVKTCVKAVEQIYTDINGEEKLEKCIQYVSAILTEKGIPATETEVRMLIEAAVKEMNSQIFSGEIIVPEVDEVVEAG